MPTNIKDLLTNALKQIEEDESADALEQRFKKLEDERNITMADVLRVVEGASDEELEALRGTVLDRQAAAEQQEREEDATGDADATRNGRDRKTKPAKRTRPGRRSGMVYDWYVDDNGEVVQTEGGVARVYTGEDEPEEVELRAAEDDGGDDA